MKFLASIAIMAVVLYASANPPTTEESVFSILERNGVFVQYTSTTVDRIGKLELRSILCIRHDQSTDTSCYFTDAARPMENGTLEGHDASEMYDAIILSGAKTSHLFGETHTALSVLQCEKSILNNNGSTEFRCRTLKPMLASTYIQPQHKPVNIIKSFSIANDFDSNFKPTLEL